MTGETVLVTGGAGFIGATLVRTLVERGEVVRVLDDLSTGQASRLEGVDAELVVADMRDRTTLDGALRGVGLVYHVAADPRVARSVEDPGHALDNNVRGTLEVLSAARDAGVERVVYASSSAVYGDALTFPTREDADVARTVSPYGVSKLAAEALCHSFTRVYDLPTVSLRYFNVYGPGQDIGTSYVVPRFFRALVTGDPIEIEGDGTQTRDFVHVEDVVEATTLAARSGRETFARSFNVGSGQRVGVLDILDQLERITGATRSEVTHLPPRVGDVHDTHADLTNSRTALGYEPRYDLPTGLEATVAWLRERLSRLES